MNGIKMLFRDEKKQKEVSSFILISVLITGIVKK